MSERLPCRGLGTLLFGRSLFSVGNTQCWDLARPDGSAEADFPTWLLVLCSTNSTSCPSRNQRWVYVRASVATHSLQCTAPRVINVLSGSVFSRRGTRHHRNITSIEIARRNFPAKHLSVSRAL